MMDGVDLLTPFMLGYTVRYHWVFHYKLFLTIQKLSRWLAANRTHGSTHFNNGYHMTHPDFNHSELETGGECLTNGSGPVSHHAQTC